MTLKTRLAVGFVATCLFTIGLILVLSQDAGARPPVPPHVFKAVRTYWHTKAERVEAFDIAWCESRYSTRATNGQYAGLFQLGEPERARYGHGPTALEQARAAHRYYAVAGWRPWPCA